jgi:predicted enzyme involved in methoxymalonyl-ACP biosynthesis
LKEEFVENVTAAYNNTPKNQLVENFYESVGFSVINKDEQKKSYVYCLKKGNV